MNEPVSPLVCSNLRFMRWPGGSILWKQNKDKVVDFWFHPAWWRAESITKSPLSNLFTVQIRGSCCPPFIQDVVCFFTCLVFSRDSPTWTPGILHSPDYSDMTFISYCPSKSQVLDDSFSSSTTRLNTRDITLSSEAVCKGSEYFLHQPARSFR